MDLPHILLLVAAGLVGGTLSTMIGGAAIFTFPALLATGLSPLNAAACNLTALTPCNFIAAIRRPYPTAAGGPQARCLDPRVLRGRAGWRRAAVTLLTPARVLAFLVPPLLGFATVLFALSPRISAWLCKRADDVVAHDPHASGHSIATLVPVSVYGGYFGAGVGVMLLGVLSVGTGGDYRAANVLKNLVTSLNSVAAAVLFIVQGVVAWSQTLAMMSGALVGGLLGSWLARVLPRELMRVIVVIVGALLTAIFVRRYWF